VPEQDVTYVKIDITDSQDRVLHTFITPVSGTGSFNYGFRVDIQPGQYMVTVSNPSIEKTLTRVFTVVSPGTSATVVTTPQVTGTLVETTTVPAVSSPEATTVTGTSLTTRVPLSPFTPLTGLVISVFICSYTVSREQEK
jgi:hypothetical protein